MNYKITLNDKELKLFEENGSELNIDSREAFEVFKKIWLRAGWDTKYVYSFAWLGRPVIQLPDDMIRIQEVIYDIKPTLIIETGIAHGGSLIFYASLLKLINQGRVLGIDIEIRPHNRKAIEAHELSPMIAMIESGSTSPEAIAQVQSHVKPDDVVLVLLDSNHSRDHVLDELRLYSEFVTKGSYIVATDGIMQEVVGAPRTKPDWEWDNPQQAVDLFLKENHDFVLDVPKPAFNESSVDSSPTYWPKAWLKRIN